jgi:hypothetical protein
MAARTEVEGLNGDYSLMILRTMSVMEITPTG